ncbi:hypothetical protein EVAR_94394_1 [Eumeta japonica]|uniref:Uncharacterized protein n=1 Tax=Eumeta variegata TaxID=151549 RepID=A0A4C1TQ01_EUMVA|nr:hypothetical protein EVAR_94394_1 [Eumeta japonica]
MVDVGCGLEAKIDIVLPEPRGDDRPLRYVHIIHNLCSQIKGRGLARAASASGPVLISKAGTGQGNRNYNIYNKTVIEIKVESEIGSY